MLSETFNRSPIFLLSVIIVICLCNLKNYTFKHIFIHKEQFTTIYGHNSSYALCLSNPLNDCPNLGIGSIEFMAWIFLTVSRACRYTVSCSWKLLKSWFKKSCCTQGTISSSLFLGWYNRDSVNRIMFLFSQATCSCGIKIAKA